MRTAAGLWIVLLGAVVVLAIASVQGQHAAPRYGKYLAACRAHHVLAQCERSLHAATAARKGKR